MCCLHIQGTLYAGTGYTTWCQNPKDWHLRICCHERSKTYCRVQGMFGNQGSVRQYDLSQTVWSTAIHITFFLVYFCVEWHTCALHFASVSLWMTLICTSGALPVCYSWINIYHISWPIGRTFFPGKCDLNLTCVLCAEGKYHFQTYKYPYIYYTTSLSWDSENNHEDDFSGSDDDFLGFYDE